MFVLIPFSTRQSAPKHCHSPDTLAYLNLIKCPKFFMKTKVLDVNESDIEDIEGMVAKPFESQDSFTAEVI